MHPPLIGCDLKADSVTSAQYNIAFDIVLSIRQEETFASVLVRNPACVVARALTLQFSRHCTSNPGFA